MIVGALTVLSEAVEAIGTLATVLLLPLTFFVIRSQALQTVVGAFMMARSSAAFSISDVSIRFRFSKSPFPSPTVSIGTLDSA